MHCHREYALLVERRPDRSVRREWPILCGRSYTIGRMQGKVDVVVPHSSLSRSHAELSLKTDDRGKLCGVVVRDLNSVNGTSVDGTLLPQGGMKHVVFGKIRCINCEGDLETGVSCRIINEPRRLETTCLPICHETDCRMKFGDSPYAYQVIRSVETSIQEKGEIFGFFPSEIDANVSLAKFAESTEPPNICSVIQASRSSDASLPVVDKNTPGAVQKAEVTEEQKKITGDISISSRLKISDGCRQARQKQNRRRKFVSKWEPDPPISRVTTTFIEKEVSCSSETIAKAVPLTVRNGARTSPAHSKLPEAVAGSNHRTQMERDRKKKLLWTDTVLKDQVNDERDVTTLRGMEQSVDEFVLQKRRTCPTEHNETRTKVVYETCFGENDSKRTKFLKLLGCGEYNNDAVGRIQGRYEVFGAMKIGGAKDERVACDLESDYLAGLRRKDGRKDGLGT